MKKVEENWCHIGAKALKDLQAHIGTALDPFGNRFSPKSWRYDSGKKLKSRFWLKSHLDFSRKRAILMEESRRKLMPHWCQSFKRPPGTYWHRSGSIWYQIFSQKLKKWLWEETEISILTKIASWFFTKKCYFNGEKSKKTDARLLPKLLEHLQAPFGTALDPFDTRISLKFKKDSRRKR